MNRRDSTKAASAVSWAVLSKDPEEISDPFLRQQTDPCSLRRLAEDERRYAHNLRRMIEPLERRVQEIESSRLWKMLAVWRRLRMRIRQKKGHWYERILFAFSRPGRKVLRRSLATVCKHLYLLFEERPVAIVPRTGRAIAGPGWGGEPDSYAQWLADNAPRPIDLLDYRSRLGSLPFQPKISIVVPVCNPPVKLFKETLQSVLEQVYGRWELCIAADGSCDPLIAAELSGLADRDQRVKVIQRHTGGRRAALANDALALVTGEFIAFLDHADLLSPDALYQTIVALNENPGWQLIYADEDKIDEDGEQRQPSFKPRWCPDNLLSRNYIGHAFVARTSLVRSVGGFRVSQEGAELYDMVLRLTEKAGLIHHLPRVLYHGRTPAQGKVDVDARLPAIAALMDALARRIEPGEVVAQVGAAGCYGIRYSLLRPGKVSILIPTKDQAHFLQVCLDSLFAVTSYRDFEVILIDNNSVEQTTVDLLARYRRLHAEQFRVLKMLVPFNFSRLMNAGAAEAQGDYLLLLNNDTEILHGDWLGPMVEQAQRPAIGCVGAKLLYPNGTVQHAGVVLGCGRSPAGHVLNGLNQEDPQARVQLHSIANYSAVTAACLMVRRELYRDLGGFDEAFAVDYNDVDFCLRAQQAGYRNIYLPHVVLYHHESVSRGHPLANSKSAQRYADEERLLRQRWSGVIADDPCYSRHLGMGGIGQSQFRRDVDRFVPESAPLPVPRPARAA
jgi:GT2 family glycosyltransferase